MPWLSDVPGLSRMTRDAIPCHDACLDRDACHQSGAASNSAIPTQLPIQSATRILRVQNGHSTGLCHGRPVAAFSPQAAPEARMGRAQEELKSTIRLHQEHQGVLRSVLSFQVWSTFRFEKDKHQGVKLTTITGAVGA